MKAVLKAIFIFLLFMTVGCSTQNSFLKKPQPDQYISQDEKQIQVNTELAERAKETAENVKGVKKSTAVVINSEISVAVKVSGFDRLRLKPIKVEVHDRIKEFNKNYNVYVTSDKKLFYELQQIENQIKGAQETPLTDILKKVNKINKNMEG